jgi:hypothetical protein
MGSLSDFAELELLDHVFNAAYSPAATVYLCLCTAVPTDTSTGASMSETANAANYARTAITFGAASSRRVTQSADVNFPQANASYGSAITGWAITDSGTYGAGNVLAHGSFSASFTPVSGNTPKVASGQVYVEISATSGGAGFTTYTANKLLDLMFRNTAWTSPAGSTFVALLNAVCSDAATTMAGQTECSGTNYARVEVNENAGASPKWTIASAGALENSGVVTIPSPGAGGYTQTVAMAIVDALSGTSANVLAYDNTNIVDQTAASGDTIQFASGAIDVSLS